MIKSIAIFLNIVLTSMYFFPFQFKGLEGFNTKMMIALMGLIICIYEIPRKRDGLVSNNLFFLTVFASVVSLCVFISVILNGTPDYAYATYVMSMLVWTGGAYAVCHFLKQVHENVNIRLLCNYLAAICVIQCAMALLIDYNPWVKQLVDSVIEQGQDFLNKSTVQRLYGIGANLDVAGSRFSAVLVLLGVVISKEFREKTSHVQVILYIAAFMFISIVGNMVARTTLVGVIVAIIYWIYDSGIWKLQLRNDYRVFFSWMTLAIAAIAFILVFLYNADPKMKKLIHFGFEGFFSLFEKGTWEVSSNDKLMTMYVFPDNLKTWIIGDGYFSNPYNTDPFYIGVKSGGYYMGTDVGYLRFIFYFGLIGLSAFIAFFIKAYNLCVKQFAEYKPLFFMLLILNFAIWFKVSTDIFPIFALLIMLPQEDNIQEKGDNKELSQQLL